MKRIRKFLLLSQADRLLLLQSAFVVAFVTMGLRIFPWLRLQRLLLKLADRHPRFLTSSRPSANRIAWGVRASSQYVPKATCLPQALAAQHLLVWFAYPADLQIGVARDKNGKLEAHAWVTSENQIIIGNVRNVDQFVSLSHMEGITTEDYGRAF
jgi:Transglutaminase-like superfamily